MLRDWPCRRNKTGPASCLSVLGHAEESVTHTSIFDCQEDTLYNIPGPFTLYRVSGRRLLEYGDILASATSRPQTEEYREGVHELPPLHGGTIIHVSLRLLRLAAVRLPTSFFCNFFIICQQCIGFLLHFFLQSKSCSSFRGIHKTVVRLSVFTWKESEVLGTASSRFCSYNASIRESYDL